MILMKLKTLKKQTIISDKIIITYSSHKNG
jgi:hypothetical protein